MLSLICVFQLIFMFWLRYFYVRQIKNIKKELDTVNSQHHNLWMSQNDLQDRYRDLQDRHRSAGVDLFNHLSSANDSFKVNLKEAKTSKKAVKTIKKPLKSSKLIVKNNKKDGKNDK
jgi:hypothetical protein